MTGWHLIEIVTTTATTGLHWLAVQETLQWRHNGLNGVSNHQPHHCLLNCSFGCRSKKTAKFRVTSLYAGNWPVTGEFPAQRASDAENVSIWWRYHEDSTKPEVPTPTKPGHEREISDKSQLLKNTRNTRPVKTTLMTRTIINQLSLPSTAGRQHTASMSVKGCYRVLMSQYIWSMYYS